MIAVLLLPALTLADGPDDPSPFGIVCPWPEVQDTGARWVRCGAGATQLVDWGSVEPRPGEFTWDAADRELDEWDKPWGLTPLPILAYTAPWASSGPDGDRGYPPNDLRHYARFVRESVARYKEDVKYWEVWNEQNISFFKGTIPQYVDMLKVASIAAHQADPDCHIVFGGTAGVDTRFIERCYELGAGPYFDVMAVHPYQWGRTFNDGWNREKVERLRALMNRKQHRATPVWLTEVGWSTAEVSDEDQARLLVQSYVSNLALNHLGVAKVFWFSVKDWGGPGHGIFADNGSRKPSFNAYSIMTRELEGRVHLGRLETGDVRCHAFSDPDEETPVLVFWSPTLEPMPLALPHLDGAMTLVDINGNEEPLPTDQLADLTATPEPQYLRLPKRAVSRLVQTDVLTEDRLSPPRYWPAPRPLPPRPWFASVQMPEGTGRLWFVPGEEQEVVVDLWNLSSEAQKATLRLAFMGTFDRLHPGVGIACEMPAMTKTPVTLSIATPDSTLGIRQLFVILKTDLDEGERGGYLHYAPLVRVAEGPTVEFLANSHLERSLYLQPEHSSGCSESCRFGSEWTYGFDVPLACDAKLEMFLGAHQAGPFKLLCSQDGEEWQTLLDTSGNRASRTLTIDDLKPGKLFLRVSGENCQVEEVMVTWVK